MRRPLRGLAVAVGASVALLSSACETRGPTLTVRVHSGLRAGAELTQVAARLTARANCEGLEGVTDGVTLTAERQADLGRGMVTVAEFRNLTRGVHAVHVVGTLRDESVIARCMIVSVNGDRVLRVPLTTDCPMDRCPEIGGTPGFTECLNGRCIDPRCEPDDPDTADLCCDRATLGAFCDTAPTLCRGSADCAPGPACAGARECVAGVCVEPVEDVCGDGTHCAAASGRCEPDEAGVDAGGDDGGVEPHVCDLCHDRAFCDGIDCVCAPGYFGDGRACTSAVVQAFAKASNTGAADRFGSAIALSGDGQTLAVSSPGEDGSLRGFGSLGDEGAPESGAVYVFRRMAGTWVLEARIKATNVGAGDGFGRSLALDGDGTVLAVGAPGEASSGPPVDGEFDEGAPGSGAVYVYRASGDEWLGGAFLKAINPGPGDAFGSSVSLSSDGDTLVVGAPGEDSGGTLVGSTPDDSAAESGAVYVYRHDTDPPRWGFEAFVKAANTGMGDAFGQSVAVSADGNVLAVGAPTEDSRAIGVDRTSDELGPDTGAVYLYRRTIDVWDFDAFVKPGIATSPVILLGFGEALALSADGTTLAVGAQHEPTAGTDVGAMPNPGARDSGAVFIYRHGVGTWAYEAFVKSNETAMGDLFGGAVALSGDGRTLLVGARRARSLSGAAFLYRRRTSEWAFDASVTDPQLGMGDEFGSAVALSADARWLAIGAAGEDSGTTGIGPATDESAPESGAAYVLNR